MSVNHTISIGSFSFRIGSGGPFGGRRTLGYHFVECTLPLERQVYVLGEAADSSARRCRQ